MMDTMGKDLKVWPSQIGYVVQRLWLVYWMDRNGKSKIIGLHIKNFKLSHLGTYNFETSFRDNYVCDYYVNVFSDSYVRYFVFF
ncbi:hypothetical protein HanIR_Chr15g0730961 [Helianthus annuus]|nr:hypothetical protein HanIR_Chr15g0730961 [Helianthus annuus]